MFSLIAALMLNISIDSIPQKNFLHINSLHLHVLHAPSFHATLKKNLLIANSEKIKFTLSVGTNKTAFTTNQMFEDELISFMKFDGRVKYRFTNELSTTFRILSVGETQMYFLSLTFKNKNTGKHLPIQL